MTQNKTDIVLPLAKDHEHLSEAADVMASIPQSLKENSDFSGASELEQFLDKMERHMQHEEETVFFSVESSGHASKELKDLVSELRSQHETLREKSDAIRDILGTSAFPLEEDEYEVLRDLLQDFCDSLVSHAETEDDRLFPHLKNIRVEEEN
jgi:iron-sulfur cluster repair protein YtfE (RIC family)